MTLEWADLKWSDFIRADIDMGARASNTHLMSDQIKSGNVQKFESVKWSRLAEKQSIHGELRFFKLTNIGRKQMLIAFYP